MKRLNASALWAVVVLVILVMCAVLLYYIDRRFGAETSAFLLGIALGIPFLLVVVAIVGGIFILIIRGTTHLHERDDIGEIERMKTLRELARTERTMRENEKADLDAQLKEMRLLEAWQRQQGNTRRTDWPKSLPDHGWPDDIDDDDNHNQGGGASYTIIE